MSIDKIKEYYAKERGFESWSELLNNIHGFQIPSHMTEVAERYAQSQTQELQEQNAELVDLLKGIVKQIEKGEKIGGYNLLTTSSIEYEFAQKLLTKHNHLKSNTNSQH